MYIIVRCASCVNCRVLRFCLFSRLVLFLFSLLLLIGCCSLCVACCLLLVVCCSLCLTRCLLTFVYCLVLAARCLSLVVC